MPAPCPLFQKSCCPALALQYSTTVGWSSLYAGFLPALGATALSQALYFYLYSAARQVIVVRIQAQSVRGPLRLAF